MGGAITLFLKRNPLPYLIFYLCFGIVLLTAAFFPKETLIYIKPLSIISITGVYVKNSTKINPWYVISMIVVMINDTFVYINFKSHFNTVAILITIYYSLCAFLLKKYVSVKDLKIINVFSFPIIISALLVVYLIFSITELVLPHLKNSLFYLVIILISLLFFTGLCFLIYIRDRYTQNFMLFASACCCLFVNALLPINELFFYNRVFTIFLNVGEIFGIFFFMKFLIDSKPTETVDEVEKYL